MLEEARITAVLPAVDIERAKRFYSEKAGLQAADVAVPDDAAAFRGGKGTMLYLYEREGGTKADHTAAGWLVDDVEEATEALRERGVVFEQYDTPELKTDGQGIADSGGARAAWFKDSEGNILAVTEF